MRCQGARCQGTGTWHQQTRGKEVPCTCPLAPCPLAPEVIFLVTFGIKWLQVVPNSSKSEMCDFFCCILLTYFLYLRPYTELIINITNPGGGSRPKPTLTKQ